MWNYLLLSAALSIGQAETTDVLPPVKPAPALLTGNPFFGSGPSAPEAAPPKLPTPVEIVAPVLPPPPPAPAAEEPAAAAASGDRWLLMRALQGTYPGSLLDGNRLSISGWTEMSYTASTADVTNQPVVWNDRANEILLQQHWIRFERAVVTSGTTDPTWGFRADVLIGSDYRFSLARGMLNSQLQNADGTQNLYGVDPIQFYANVYVPTLFQGTNFMLGRCYTPFGVESLEAVSTPLVSRSYAFNWCPPFTHTGLMAQTTFSPKWSGVFMLANGNDIFIDPAEEMRFTGRVQWTSTDKRNSVAFGTSLGRGKFNAGEPFAPATVALPFEPAGRNNINVFDLVFTHNINPRLVYNFECIYGYQTGVPTGVVGGVIRADATHSTAHWGSLVNYLTYTFSPRVSSVTRLEFFDDFDGQRTGFEGLYTAITAGLQFRPRKAIVIRPELRYDYNGYSRPFEGKHDLFTAAADVIFRW